MRSRRLILRAVLPPVLLLMAVPACSPGGDAASAPSSPSTDGKLVYAAEKEPDCWDPHSSAQDVTSFLQRPVFDSLVYQNPAGELVPWLAESWKVADGGKSYTFTLRSGVTFHDGTPLDAAAVKANFDHITAKETNSQYAAGLLGPYESTTVLDPRRVEIRFRQAYAPFLQAASTTFLGIAAPASLTGGEDKLCSGSLAVGSGPFRLGAYTRGQQRSYQRNDAYQWAPDGAAQSGPARLAELTIRFMTEDATRVGALTSGQVDAAGAIPAAQVAQVKNDNRLTVVSTDIPGAVNAFYLNTKGALFSDVRVRRAFQRIIDLESVVGSVFQGTGSRAWSLLSPSTPASYAADLEGTWSYDPDQAARLLDEAGWTGRDAQGYRTKNGTVLTVVAPVYGKPTVFSQAVQGNLKKAGIKLDLAASTDATQVYTLLDEGRYDVVEMAWARGDGDILRHFFRSTETLSNGGHNFAQVADPQVDTWLDEAAAAQDPRQRAEKYRLVQKWILDQAVALPAYVSKAVVGIGPQVHDLRPGISGWPEFYGAWAQAR